MDVKFFLILSFFILPYFRFFEAYRILVFKTSTKVLYYISLFVWQYSFFLLYSRHSWFLISILVLFLVINEEFNISTALFLPYPYLYPCFYIFNILNSTPTRILHPLTRINSKFNFYELHKFNIENFNLLDRGWCFLTKWKHSDNFMITFFLIFWLI